MYLYKWFTSEEHANLFLKHGEVLFRDSEYFRKLESKNIGDRNELKIPVSRPKKIIGDKNFSIKDVTFDFNSETQKFLFCTSVEEVKPDMEYNFCVKIDKEEFIKLFRNQIAFELYHKSLSENEIYRINQPDNQKLAVLTGAIQYKSDYKLSYNKDEISMKVPSSETSKPYFIKDHYYEPQKEFRFVLEFNKSLPVDSKNNCLVSRLGNLDKIGEIKIVERCQVPTTDVNHKRLRGQFTAPKF